MIGLRPTELAIVLLVLTLAAVYQFSQTPALNLKRAAIMILVIVLSSAILWHFVKTGHDMPRSATSSSIAR